MIVTVPVIAYFINRSLTSLTVFFLLMMLIRQKKTKLIVLIRSHKPVWTYVTADLLKSRMLWNVGFFFFLSIWYIGLCSSSRAMVSRYYSRPDGGARVEVFTFLPIYFCPDSLGSPKQNKKKKLQALFGSTNLDLFANLRNMQNLILRTCFMIFGLSSQILLFNSSPWEPQQLTKTFVSSCNSQVHRFTQNLKGICMRSFWGSVSDPLLTAQYHSIWH